METSLTTRLIDTATTADWTFLTNPHDEYETWRRGMVEDLWADGESLNWGVNPDTAAALRRRTDGAAAKHGVSADDLYSDTLLHMAVRPERVSTAPRRELAWYAKGVASNLAKPPQRLSQREESLEAILSSPAGGME